MCMCHASACDACLRMKSWLAWGRVAQAHASEKTIVYFLTCAAVDFAASALGSLPALRGLALRALHGRMKQAAREATLAEFAALQAGAVGHGSCC